MSAMASEITGVSIFFTKPFVQAQIKENFARDRWIPRTQGQ